MVRLVRNTFAFCFAVFCSHSLLGQNSPATLTSPTAGSTLGSTVTFSWTTGTGVTAYYLSLGTNGPGSANVWESGSITTTTVTAKNLPQNGVTMNATLFSMIGGVWKPQYYTFTEGQLAALTSPANGSIIPGTATFNWTAGSGGTAYFLALGSNGQGSANLWESGSTTAMTATPKNLPLNGATIYATLYTMINGVWEPAYYTFTEAQPAALTSPSAGSILPGTTTFNWSAGKGVTAYFLSLGTNGVGSANVWESGSTTAMTVTAKNLPQNAVTIYATLFSMINGAWQPVHYTFTESQLARMTSPASGATLVGTTTFSWTQGTGATAYFLSLGTNGQGSANVYESGSITATTVTAKNLPETGATIYATLFSMIGGVWQPSYTSYSSVGLARLTSPANGTVFPGTSVTFTWSAGTGVNTYFLSLGTGGQVANVWESGSTTATSVTANKLPTNGETINATLFSMVNGSWVAAPVQTFTADGAVAPLLAISANGKYLINKNTGNPFYINGDTGWGLATSLDASDVTNYLSTRAAQGYNFLWVAAADNSYQDNPPDNFYGQAPFSGADFTNENSAYWSNLDSVITEAGQYGMVVALNPAFVGLSYPGGYINSYTNSSCSTLTSYGSFLGARYKNFPNIVWATGGDANYGSGVYSKLNCLDQGILSADPNHMITMEACPQATCGVGHSSTAQDWTSANVGGTPVTMNMNWVYNQWESVQSQCAANYAAPQTAGPSLIGETWYENDHGLTALQVREEGYWGVLSGCTLGYIFGNDPIWCYNQTSSLASCPGSPTWQSQLTSNGSTTQQWMGNLMRSREFWLMVPDSSNAVLTGGFGSGTSISVAGCTSDGQTCIVYDPLGSSQAPQIKMTHFTGTVQAWWFNPQTGATTNLGTVANSGTHTFTPSNGNDWVLVLDLASANLPAPGTGTLQ